MLMRPPLALYGRYEALLEHLPRELTTLRATLPPSIRLLPRGRLGKLRGLTVASLLQGLQCRELPQTEQRRKTVTFALPDPGSIEGAASALPGWGH